MRTYFQNGLIGNSSYEMEETDIFGILELDDRTTNKYAYPGDEINYTLDAELCILYDTLRDIVFENIEKYYIESYTLPIWIQEAGQNSDCAIDVDIFNELISDSKIPNLYKHLYLVDCQFLVGTIQNLLSAMEDAFIRYYMIISSLDYEEMHKGLTDSNGTIFVLSQNATHASTMIETYFTKAYSILDIICKLCYEIQYKQVEFNSYKKIKSADILWGDRKKLKINNTIGTLFEKCEFISTIEALRNEVVHNGTWELNPKIFIRFQNSQVVEKFMLFPDISQGHLATSKNRKHFFSKGIKINDVLVDIHFEFKTRLLKTINVINSMKDI